MVFKIEFYDNTVTLWSKGGEPERIRDYNPIIYVSSEEKIRDLETTLCREEILSTSIVSRRTSWRNGEEDVLRVELKDINQIKKLGRNIRKDRKPGKIRLYNVDFSLQFRYCLENNLVPEHRRLEISEICISRKKVENEKVDKIMVDQCVYRGSEEENLKRLNIYLEEKDPDILIVNTSELVPLVHKKSREIDLTDFHLGRAAGYRKLSGGSNFESYGTTKYSPPRYDVPGRAIVNRSNSFFLEKTGMHGILDLVRRSWKPVQEAAWASIGNILTAIQVRHAHINNVLVPWKPWRHEMFKEMSVLHQSDRGGFIFSPDTGLHEEVYECDFSSLYPNIICTRNISPETIRCECHDNEDVPELGYSICEEKGYLRDVLEPIIHDRDKIKDQIRNCNDKIQKEKLEAKSDALKWILVSCFGYQGYNNAKFGRIECHEAINAFAREIMMKTKDLFERNGWRIIHGIIDSIWVEAADGIKTVDIGRICKQITDEIGIKLEIEAKYEWIAFCPRKKEAGGALNKYFGKKNDGYYKYRGVEIRRSNVPDFIKKSQEDMIECLDRTKKPEQVCQLVKKQLNHLKTGRVNPEKLVITRRMSKNTDEYLQNLKSVSAARRAKKLFSVDFRKGEKIKYVVTDGKKRGIERVCNYGLEETEKYDPNFYAKKLLEACETVVSPLGWDIKNINQFISDKRDINLQVFENS